MSLASDEVQLLKELFNLIDEDGSGTVDKAELRTFLNHLPNFKEDKFPSLFAKIDEDKSGEVDFDEFTEVLNVVCRELPTDEIIATVTQERDRKAEAMRKKRAMFEQKEQKGPEVVSRGRGKSVNKQVTVVEPVADNSKELEELKARVRALEEENARLQREAEEARAQAAKAQAEAEAAAKANSSNQQKEFVCPKCADKDSEIERLRRENERKQRDLEDAQRAEKEAQAAAAAASKSASASAQSEGEISRLKDELAAVRKQLEAEREANHSMRGKNAVAPFGDPSSFAGVSQNTADQRRTRAFYRWLQEETVKINQHNARMRSRSPRTPRTARTPGGYIAS